MLVNKTYEISSCDDIELGIKRESKLEFKLSYDDSKQIRAIVCIIPGFGADINDDLYISDYVARNYEVAVINVNYHCIGNRPQTGASYYLDNIDKLILDTSLNAINLQVPFNVYDINSYDELNNNMRYINNELSRLKQDGILSQNYCLNLHTSLAPTKNEYQNFGIMQAQDILNAILFIKSNLPFKISTGGGVKVILFGSSHGGYLANLCAKISPWNIDFVIDNSSYVNLDKFWRIIGFGKEVDFMQYAEFSTFDFFQNINMHLSTKTFWTSNKNSPYYFSKARKLIREILQNDHIKTQSLYPKPKYILYHSKFDQYVDLSEREELIKNLNKNGFEVEFYKFLSEKDIDGTFIKDLTHGMGISMKLLIKKHLSQILNEEIKNKDCKKEISYKSDDLIYTFKEEDNKIKLDITKA